MSAVNIPRQKWLDSLNEVLGEPTDLGLEDFAAGLPFIVTAKDCARAARVLGPQYDYLARLSELYGIRILGLSCIDTADGLMTRLLFRSDTEAVEFALRYC